MFVFDELKWVRLEQLPGVQVLNVREELPRNLYACAPFSTMLPSG
jgi:hypothetical protein